VTAGKSLLAHRSTPARPSPFSDETHLRLEAGPLPLCGTLAAILFSLPHNGGAHSAPARERCGATGPPRATEPGCGAEPHVRRLCEYEDLDH
jgi:hypothetical protein